MFIEDGSTLTASNRVVLKNINSAHMFNSVLCFVEPVILLVYLQWAAFGTILSQMNPFHSLETLFW
jgi:hypothetical protein